MYKSIFKTLAILICVITVPFLLAWYGFGFYLTAISTTLGIFYLSKFFAQDIGHLKIAMLNFLFLYLELVIFAYLLDHYVDYKLSVLHEGSMEYEKYLELWIADGGRDLMPILGFMRSFGYSLSLYVGLKIVVCLKKLKT